MYGLLTESKTSLQTQAREKNRNMGSFGALGCRESWGVFLGHHHQHGWAPFIPCACISLLKLQMCRTSISPSLSHESHLARGRQSTFIHRIPNTAYNGWDTPQRKTGCSGQNTSQVEMLIVC